MRRKAWFFGKAVLVVAVVALAAGLVMVLWNTVVTNALSGAHALDYVHALGLLILCRLLFGGFRGRGFGHRRGQWEKWQSLSPQEREALSQRWQGCGRSRERGEGPRPSATP
jgi:hypothetical protein